MWMRTFVPDYLKDVPITDKAINEVYGDINTEITVYGGFEVTPAIRVSLMWVSQKSIKYSFYISLSLLSFQS